MGADLGPTYRSRVLLRFLATGLVVVGLLAIGAPVSDAGPSAPPASLVSAGFPTSIRHVVVVMLENEEAKNVLANGTYERFLAEHFAYAAEFYSPLHYSLPNYLAATSGHPTNLFRPFVQRNIGNLVNGAGLSWKAYEESMPTACDLAPGYTPGGYDANHNPFALYEPLINNTAYCRSHVTDFTTLSRDLRNGRMPNYAFVVPNDRHDGHNTSLGTADAWLSGWLPGLLSAPFFRTAAIFVTYDEGTTNAGANGTTGGGHIYMALVSPFARHAYVSFRNYTTYSLLTTTEWLLGLGRTHDHDSWATYPPMRELFADPVTVAGIVLTRNGTVASGVTVEDGAGARTTTGALGQFTLDLTPGNYTLFVPGASGIRGSLAITVPKIGLGGLVLRIR